MMKKKQSHRRLIRQEYLQLHNFVGYYGDEEFKLFLDYNDPYAYRCFGTDSYCTDFCFYITYNKNGDIEDVRVTYYDGSGIQDVCPYLEYTKTEWMELTELPIVFGFDEDGCDEHWHYALMVQFRQNYPHLFSHDDEEGDFYE